MKEERPALIMTSTSYTPDEDLNFLIKALDICDEQGGKYQYRVIVTGKGPLKEHFKGVFEERNKMWHHVKIE